MDNLKESNKSIIFPLIGFIPNFLVNLFYIFGCENTLFDISNILGFTAFSTIAQTFFLFSMSLKGFNDECVYYANRKSFIYKIISVLLFIYAFTSIFLFKDKLIVISAFIMAYSFFTIYIVKRFFFASRQRDDYQIRWQKKNSGIDPDSQDSNIFWSLKFWFSPRVSISRNRLPKINSFHILFFALALSQRILIICIPYGIYIFAYFLEYAFILYTETKGFCTSIVYSPSKGVDKWTVRIVDYTNKRQITYIAYNQPYFVSGDYVRVVTGMFTKKVVTCSKTSRTTY